MHLFQEVVLLLLSLPFKNLEMFSKSFIFIRIPALSTAVRVCGEGKVKGFVAKLIPCPAHTQSLPVVSPPGAVVHTPMSITALILSY